MDTRKAIEKLGLPKSDYVTPSHIKKEKKIARRKMRYDKHVTKQTIEQQTSGKLIEENHNGYDYSPEFTSRAVSWHLGNLWMKTNKFRGDHERFCLFFRGLREKFQTLLLHWPPEKKRDWSFWFIMDLLDIYRELKLEAGDILWEKCATQFRKLGLVIKETPVTLVYVCEENTDHFSDYLRFRERYPNHVSEEVIGEGIMRVFRLTVRTTLEFINQHGLPQDIERIKKEGS